MEEKRTGHLFSLSFFLEKQKSTIKPPDGKQTKIDINLKCIRSKQSLNNGTYFKFYSVTAWQEKGKGLGRQGTFKGSIIKVDPTDHIEVSLVR